MAKGKRGRRKTVKSESDSLVIGNKPSTSKDLNQPNSATDNVTRVLRPRKSNTHQFNLDDFYQQLCDDSTSPFKGFPDAQTDEASPKESHVRDLFMDEYIADNTQNIISPKVAKYDNFDQLLSPKHQTSFRVKNPKTYCNKRRKPPPIEPQLFEFQDCKNKESILQWLNDTRNHFDRLTQTQQQTNREESEYASLEMTSVSQTGPKRLKTTPIRRTRSPYWLRTRSLNIHETKNVSSRITSHSLPGDTASLENYHIEEVTTDEEAVGPAEHEAKMLIDYMEDEYLDSLDKEILQQQKDDKKNSTGWDRIKAIKKAINFKRTPKQLNITLQSTESKKGEEIMRLPSFDLQIVENYFVEKMERLLNNQIEKKKECCKRHLHENVPESNTIKVQDACDLGNNLINILRPLATKVNEEELLELMKLFNEIKKVLALFKVNTCKTSTQTISCKLSDKEVQTVIHKNDAKIQTVQSKAHKEIQTVHNKHDAEIQTNNEDRKMAKKDSKGVMMDRRITTGSTTPSDILFIDENQKVEDDNRDDLDCFFEDLHFQTEDMVKNDNKENTDVNLPNRSEPSCKSFPTTEPLASRTDLKYPESPKTVKICSKETPSKISQNRNNYAGPSNINSHSGMKPQSHEQFKYNVNNVNIEKSAESVLLCSVPSKSKDNSGLKRLRQSPINESFSTKRPCHKFINSDVSIDFDSCPQTEPPQVIDEEEEKIYKFSEGSDDVNFDEILANALKKYESTHEVEPVKPPVTSGKTSDQDLLDRCELLIYNATKPSRPQNAECKDTTIKREEKPTIIYSGDVFKSSSPYFDADNLCKIDKDVEDYFHKPASIIEEAYARIESTPKCIRRSLFSAEPQRQSDKLSESLFGSGNNRTIVPSNTTQNFIDATFNEQNLNKIISVDDESDEEVKSITSSKSKINILQNVVVKMSDQNNMNSDSEGSDVEILEGTPQKKIPSFSERRREAILDVTLPPPLEFQDDQMDYESENDVTLIPKKLSPKRRPPICINKITSTPCSGKPLSENPLSLSPIAAETKRNMGPIEWAQQSKFSPLTIIKKPQRINSPRTSSKQQRSILNYVKPSQDAKSQNDQLEPVVSSKPCIACTRLSKDQIIAISSMTNKKLATYSTTFSLKVTHMIVSVNEKNCIKDHTFKYVAAVAAGIWVLNFKWVQECLQKNCIVPEEPYEALDISGLPGPKLSRLTRLKNPLFKGFQIYASGPFSSTTQKDVESIVEMLGGKIVGRPDDLLNKDGHIGVIVTEVRATPDFDLYESWLEALKVVTVDIEWISRSVGQYKLLSLHPFALCSDDSIDNLGYPPELLLKDPFSFSQNNYSTS